MTERAVRYPLRLKLLFFGGVLAVVPTLLVGFGLMEINAATLETQNRELRLAVADDIAASLDSSVTDARESLLGVQQVLTNERLDDDTRIEIATALVESDPLLDTVAVFDQQGAYIAQIDQSGRPLSNEKLAADVAKRAANEPIVVGTPRRFETSYEVPLTMAIRPRPSVVTGFLVARLPLAPVQTRAMEVGRVRLSEQSRVDVVDLDGTVLVSSKAAEVGSKLPAEGMMKDLATIVRQGVAHSGEHPTRPVLVSARPLGDLPWVARVEVPLDEAYASLTQMRIVVTIATIAAALLALVAAFVFARRLTQPLEGLIAMTRNLASRAFASRVEVDTNDEIAVVADSLNRAAADLEASEEAMARELAIRSDLGRYLPAELVDNVVRREQVMELGGERREITVLFADVVRFTPLCDHHPPEVVVSVLNELFTILTTIVFETGGTVDKFIGDCVMAFWGAPREDPDHARHALEAAEKMVRFLEFGNSRWMKDYGIEVKLAIGVNTGEVVIGNIGSDTRMEYTAIGGTVNRAARLEALANPGQVLVTKETAALTSDIFDFRNVSTELLSTGEDQTDVFEVVL